MIDSYFGIVVGRPHLDLIPVSTMNYEVGNNKLLNVFAS